MSGPWGDPGLDPYDPYGEGGWGPADDEEADLAAEAEHARGQG